MIVALVLGFVAFGILTTPRALAWVVAVLLALDGYTYDKPAEIVAAAALAIFLTLTATRSTA